MATARDGRRREGMNAAPSICEQCSGRGIGTDRSDADPDGRRGKEGGGGLDVGRAFDGDDGVRAIRHRPTGRDSRSDSWGQDRRGVSGPDLQRDDDTSTGVGCPDGKTVEGGVRERRQGVERVNVAGQHAADEPSYRDLLDGQDRRDAAETCDGRLEIEQKLLGV